MGILNPPVLASAIPREPFTTIMSHNPVVYWPMDDASGVLTNYGSLASKDATANGTPVYESAGIVPRSGRGCIQFDGSTDYFQVTDAAISGTDQEFSFGCWIETDGGLSARTVFQQQDATGAYCGFRLYTNSGVLIFQSHHTDASSQSVQVFGLAELQDNTPMYVGVSATPTEFRLYVEGFQLASVARTTVTYEAGSDIFIGRAEGAYRYWIGKISDLFILDSALTASQHLEISRKGQLQIERPLGDHFKDARVVVDSPTPTTFTCVGAGSDPVVDPVLNGIIALPRSIWLKFVPPVLDENYLVTLDSTANSAPVTVIEAYVGDDDLEVPIWNTYQDVMTIQANSAVELGVLEETLTAGQAYWFQAGVTKSGIFSPGPFDVTVETLTPPSNDNFADAEDIDVSAVGTLDSVTNGATIEDSQECVRTSCNEHSVWYKFTANATGNITLSLGKSPNYKYYGIAVWDATVDAISVVGDIDWTTPLAYDDNFDLGNGEVTIAVTSGNEYVFHVTQNSLIQDAFTLDWTVIA